MHTLSCFINIETASFPAFSSTCLTKVTLSLSLTLFITDYLQESDLVVLSENSYLDLLARVHACKLICTSSLKTSYWSEHIHFLLQARLRVRRQVLVVRLNAILQKLIGSESLYRSHPSLYNRQILIENENENHCRKLKISFL